MSLCLDWLFRNIQNYNIQRYGLKRQTPFSWIFRRTFFRQPCHFKEKILTGCTRIMDYLLLFDPYEINLPAIYLGKSVEEMQCGMEACPFWSEWTPFSRCSVSCGPDGVMTRQRTCIGDGHCLGNWYCSKQYLLTMVSASELASVLFEQIATDRGLTAIGRWPLPLL